MAIRLIDLREKVQNNFKNLIQNSDDNINMKVYAVIVTYGNRFHLERISV